MTKNDFLSFFGKKLLIFGNRRKTMKRVKCFAFLFLILIFLILRSVEMWYGRGLAYFE